MSRFSAKVLLALIAVGLVLMLASPAMAQEAAEAERVVERYPLLLDSVGTQMLAGALGAALVVYAGARAISQIGVAAVESIARQPEVAGQINTSMIIVAAMIEGATLFGVIVTLLTVLA